jgi:hypothetical protein
LTKDFSFEIQKRIIASGAAILIAAFIPAISLGQGIPSPVTPQIMGKAANFFRYFSKFDNGWLLAFPRTLTASFGKDQVEVFNKTGARVLSLDILSAVPDAQGATIFDVAASREGRIAIAADFVGTGKQLPPSLLVYGPEGGLERAVALAPEREIAYLALDSDGSIWAMGSGAGDSYPAIIPTVTRYNAAGNEEGSFFPRSMFPRDARALVEGPNVGGWASFGLTKDAFWFLLPASRKVVVARKEDGSVLRSVSFSPPPWTGPSDYSHGTRTFLAPRAALVSGHLVIQAAYRTSRGSYRTAIFALDLAANTWQRLPRPDVASPIQWLVGAEGDDLVFLGRPTIAPSWRLYEHSALSDEAAGTVSMQSNQ